MDKPPFPGSTPATRSKLFTTSGNPPATLGKPLATYGKALAELENALAFGGKGVAITGEAFAGWGFDVRWVRFPKHITLFSTLSQLEFESLVESIVWVQGGVSEKLRLSKRLNV